MKVPRWFFLVWFLIVPMLSACWKPPTIITYVPLPENLGSHQLSDIRPLRPMEENYVVRSGDTVYGIAKCLQVGLVDLVALNSLEPPYTIWVGQIVLIPEGADFRRCEEQQKLVVDGTVGSTPAQEVLDLNQSLIVSPPAVAEEQFSVLPQVPPRAGKKFLWPVNGKVISDFGPKPGKLRNDGINIAAPLGTVVRAAENGVVAYAGNELRGYGKMLLIRHKGGWITAYAHNHELLVKQGRIVSRGEAIARVGQTGGVDRPQTHFEIRRGEKAINPNEHLSWK